MSNTQKRKSEFSTWDEMVAEVAKAPFQLPLPDGETLFVNQPTGRQMFDAEEMAISGGGSSRDQLRLLIGDEGWEQIEPLVLDAPGEAAGVLVRRILKHFGRDLGEGDSPS